MSRVTHLPHNFDFKALQVFVVTAEQGGMTQSAKVLGLTQSGVSQTISSLEEAVGKQLFDRTVRPIALTNAGRALLLHGRKILTDMHKAYFEASETDRRVFATLTISMPESLANVVGPHLYRKKSSLARFWRILSGLTPDQRNLFDSHAVDMVITEESGIAEMTGIVRHSIVSEPYILIFPKSFELPTELGQHLAASNLIRFSLRSSAGRQTEAQLNRLQLEFPAHIEFDTASCQTTAVADGLGWGITTPICLIQRPGLLDSLVVKPINRGGFTRRLTLIARQGALGGAPQSVAEECRDILRYDVIPQIAERFPWLKDELKVIEE